MASQSRLRDGVNAVQVSCCQSRALNARCDRRLSRLLLVKTLMKSDSERTILVRFYTATIPVKFCKPLILQIWRHDE